MTSETLAKDELNIEILETLTQNIEVLTKLDKTVAAQQEQLNKHFQQSGRIIVGLSNMIGKSLHVILEKTTAAEKAVESLHRAQVEKTPPQGANSMTIALTALLSACGALLLADWIIV